MYLIISVELVLWGAFLITQYKAMKENDKRLATLSWFCGLLLAITLLINFSRL